MKILVTGSNGQLGSELRVLAPGITGMEFLFTDYNELDITDEAQINAFFAAEKPAWVINCAAYTAVDKAESEPEAAMRLNADAPAILAKAAKKSCAGMVHISTDYVFGGEGYRPYRETDTASPKGIYAVSKRRGEELVLQENPDAVIVRTAWLYSVYGHNFVKTIINKGREKGELKVVADQIGSPTWAADLATAIITLIKAGVKSEIIHFTNEGACSWFDFAKTIVEISGINCKILPTDTAGYPLPAPRPYYSVLDKSKFSTLTGLNIPWWRESLKKCIALLNEQG